MTRRRRTRPEPAGQPPENVAPRPENGAERPGNGAERGEDLLPTPEDLLPTPFTIVIDTREQRPFRFGSIRADARQGNRPLLVRTVVDTLASGDYSLRGFEECIAVERKSLGDLFGTLGQGRERFERELQRLAQLQFGAVVIEAEWSEILAGAPHSELSPKTVFRSVIAWQQRFPRVHWWACPGREVAEVVTFRVLERYWRDYVVRRGKE